MTNEDLMIELEELENETAIHAECKDNYEVAPCCHLYKEACRIAGMTEDDVVSFDWDGAEELYEALDDLGIIDILEKRLKTTDRRRYETSPIDDIECSRFWPGDQVCRYECADGAIRAYYIKRSVLMELVENIIGDNEDDVEEDGPSLEDVDYYLNEDWEG